MNNHLDREMQIYNHLLNLAISRFTWTNLPMGLTSEQLEKMLISKGQLAGFNYNGGIYILPCFGETDLNLYGLPTHYRIMSMNGNFNISKSVDDIVLLNNNPSFTNDIDTLEYYSKLLANIDSTQDVNLFQQNIPKILVTDENSKLTAKNIIKKLQEFKFVIFAKKGINNFIQADNILDNQVPYLLDKLQAFRQDKFNEFLSLNGINNTNYEKKERLITDEVNSNNEFIKINIDLMYDERKKFCTEMNSKFNTNITVKKREVEEIGTVYDTTTKTDRE